MPRRDTDRNLLFGINALQNDFITRDALIAGMAAWALEKHRSLGDILVERSALDPEESARSRDERPAGRCVVAEHRSIGVLSRFHAIDK